jgi:hypothetical protein
LDSVQFIGKGRVLIQFEDGHNVHAALLDAIRNDFRILRVFRLQPEFTPSAWEALVDDFGDRRRPVSTYAYDSSRGEFKRTATNSFILTPR